MDGADRDPELLAELDHYGKLELDHYHDYLPVDHVAIFDERGAPMDDHRISVVTNLAVSAEYPTYRIIVGISDIRACLTVEQSRHLREQLERAEIDAARAIALGDDKRST